MTKRLPRHDDDESGPTRTCLVTREARDREGLIRFVLSPDGAVTPDIRNRLPGRGVWLTASRAIVAEGVRRKVFDRGFKKPAASPADLAGDVEGLLERDALQMLSLANKAGLVVAGAGKVAEAMAGDATAVIHAADGAPDGIRKLDQAMRRTGRAIRRVNLFRSSQLGLALGRPNVIHAALAPGSAGKAFLARCERLRLFRAQDTDQSVESHEQTDDSGSQNDTHSEDDTHTASGHGPGSGTDE